MSSGLQLLLHDALQLLLIKMELPAMLQDTSKGSVLYGSRHSSVS